MPILLPRLMIFALLLIPLNIGLADAKSFIDDQSRISATSDDLVVLVRGNQPAATIIMAREPLETHRIAADLLVEYVERMTGARLTVVDDPAEVQTEHRIWLGMRPEVGEAFAGTDLTFSHAEEILIKARPGHLLLAGRDEMVQDDPVHAGTLLSTLTFLQERLDIRWLWPGELGIDVIAATDIAFAPFEYRYHPPLNHRNPRSGSLGGLARARARDDLINPLPNQAQMIEQYVGSLARMREILSERDNQNRLWFNLQRVRAKHSWQNTTHFDRAMQGSLRFSGGHAFTKWFDRFAEEHPEWFALQPNGERVSEQEDPYPSRSRVKLCISNPEVAAQVIQDRVEMLERDPTVKTVSVSPNDYGWRGYCVCENCKAWDSPDGPMLPRPLEWREGNLEHYALTDRYVKFWNIIAQGLRERFPDRDVRLGVWAYRAYEAAPHAERVDSMIIPGYVGILLREHGANYQARIERDMANWQGWIDKGAGGMVWRPNALKRSGGLPEIHPHRLSDLMNRLADMKLVGYELDTVTHHWGAQGPHYYVMTQLLWNPRLKAQDILNDYYGRAFGPDAAPYMAAYFATFEQLYYKIAETYGPSGSKRHGVFERLFEDLPAAYRELRLGPTLGRNMADHAWDDYLWEKPGALFTAEQLGETYLLEAERIVADGPQKYRDRVAFVRASWEYGKANLDCMDAMMDVRARRGDKDEVIARAFEAATRRERILLENVHTAAIGTQGWHNSRPELFGPPPADIAERWDGSGDDVFGPLAEPMDEED